MLIKMMRRSFAIILFVFTACSEHTIDPFCDGRARVQKQNNASLATLRMTYREDNSVAVVLEFQSALSSLERQKLDSPDSLFSMRGSQTCTLKKSDVRSSSEKLIVNYLYECGDGNALKNVDINLLDQFSSIDEVESFISTDAVDKHFVISRKCDRPIFNLATQDPN